MIKVKSSQTIEKIIENVERVIVGKRKIIEKTLVAMLAQGHILLEDVPGVGKTRMVKALARSIGGSFKRIQFTPDLLPTDVIGVSVFNPKTMEFEFKPGPIMTHILLADEINRTSPKTQSALLEAMEERTITADGITHSIHGPFVVMATQNPIEYEGTYALPEAQMDRFMLKLHLGYPDRESEIEVLSRSSMIEQIESLSPVCTVQEIMEMQRQVSDVYVDRLIKEYIVDICQQTRSHKEVLLGVSPRGSVAVYKAAQAWAYLQLRDFVTPDDVKELMFETLGHRIVLKAEARFEGVSPSRVLAEIIENVPVPITRGQRKEVK